MNKETKIKIIIFAVIGLFVLLVLFLFLKSGNKEEETDKEIIVRSDIDAEFTLNDMLNVNDKTKPRRNNYSPNNKVDLSGGYQDADPDAIRLQALLKANQEREDSIMLENQREMMKLVDSIKADGRPQPKKTTPPVEKKEIKIAEVQKAPEEPAPKSRFYNPDKPEPKRNTVAAVVHGTQELRNGSAIKLRLLEELITTNGQIVPANTYVFGKVSLTGERMTIKIESVRLDDLITSVKMDVYDKDGMKGINVPNSVKAEAVQEATTQGLNSFNMPYSDDILSTGVTAVAQAGKSVIGKQARIIKVTVKSNYKIYLKDEAN